MKKYVSHKVVEAAKITAMGQVMTNDYGHEPVLRGWRLVLDGVEDAVIVEPEVFERTKPVGDDLGYLVKYKDGYQAWSPSKPFEEGYTALDQSNVSPTLADFNPSGLSVVDETKRLTDKLMNYINANVPAGRERSIAITNIEQGAMWAVKANFVKGGS